MAQDDAYALYLAKNYAAGKKRAGGEKRCLEQPLGFVTDIYIYMSCAVNRFAQFYKIAQQINGYIYSCTTYRCITKLGHYP